LRRVRRFLGCSAVALAAMAAMGCPDHGTSARDGGSDGIGSEASSSLTLDIGVSGCGQYAADGNCDPDAGVGPCCTGAPPLALSFAPVGSPELTQFLWKFGDGSPDTTERAPSHVYPRPGVYHVTLLGGGASTGMVNPPQPLTVVVESLATGALCDGDSQCGDGLTCLCAPGAGCPPAFVRGVCSAACDTVACGATATCASISVVPAADAGTGAPVCLASCQKSADCPSGLVCVTLPAAGSAPATPWTLGCLPPGALQDLGEPCRDANEVLDDSACSTGLCADVGALGVCSATCDDSRPCPDQAACVLTPDGQPRCLRTCTAGTDCAARDPLLACAPAQRAGAGTGAVMVCSPKACSSDAACAPSGRCGPNAVCVRMGS
jgi:hypothetical protein